MSTLRKYRIKVEERQNGDKYYTPQVGTPKLIGRRSVYLFTDWKNIISDGESSSTSSINYPTEQGAKELIDRYKENISIQEGNQVKKISFIEVD
jgi:hypothetical protein